VNSDELLRTFRSESPPPDEATTQRVYNRATTGRPPRVTRRRLALALVLVAVTGTGFGVSALMREGSRSVSLGGFEPGITTLGVNPFGADGKLVTFQQLVAEKASHGYDIPIPDSPLANSHNIGSIWENPATGEEAVVYYPSSGIELVYCGSCGVDYTGFPADQIETIHGIRALVFPAGGPYIFAAVLFPIPAAGLVTLLGPGPVSDLVSVARTLRINP